MIGAIIGDITGSKYEFDNIRSKGFDLLTPGSFFTDDTVMTLAVAKAILNCNGEYINLDQQVIKCMQELGCKYPDKGYGAHFSQWLIDDNPKPYGSKGNGAAMRIAPVAYVARDLDELKTLCYKVTSVTHNTEEAIKSAEAVASCIFLARKGYSKSEIEKFVETHYYKLDYDYKMLNRHYKFTELAIQSVPQAIFCFLEGKTFDDVIKTSISIGGDSDTIACIAGSIAGEFFSILNSTKQEALSFLSQDLQDIYTAFEAKFIANN